MPDRFSGNNRHRASKSCASLPKDANIETDSMAIATTGSFAKREADELLRRVTVRIAAAAKSQGIDEMHDLRVATRRFIGSLAALPLCFPRGESKRMRRGLKRIMAEAGAVRNYDVAMHVIARLELPQSGGLLRQLQKRRDSAASTLSASLHRWKARDLPARWRAAVNSGRGHRDADADCNASPIQLTAKRILSDMVGEHFRRGEAATAKKTPAHKIHRFRIAAKNFRYTLVFFAPLYADSLATPIDRLKEIQTLLGDINDCATVRRIIKEESDDDIRKTILSALRKRQRKKIKDFRDQYAAEFSSAAALRQWQETVRRVVTRTTDKHPLS